MADRELFLEFQKVWSLERVKNMTLEEYTNVGGSQRDDFSYWIESKLDKLGSIWGGSGFKFGIFKRNDTGKKQDDGTHTYTGDYAWYSFLGETKEAVFAKIKEAIIKIIEASRNNQLEEIENVREFGNSTKWKIAFHYQNIDDIKIVCIFSEGVLKKIAEKELENKNLKTYEIYQRLLGDKAYTLETMSKEKSMPLWNKYRSENNELEEFSDESDESESKANITNPLNQILYGPPGTGKTYNTINKALEILLEYKQIEKIPESREEQRALFKKFKEQIAFITFHQSYSYEEFVEGIKPVLVNENGEEIENENSKDMVYRTKSGIFKQFCERARKNFDMSQQEHNNNEESIDYQKTLWRIYTIPAGERKNDYFEECYKEEVIWIYKGFDDKQSSFEKGKISGDYLVIPTAGAGRSKRIRAFGIFGKFVKEEKGKLYREVKWLWKDTSLRQEGVLIPEANFGRPTF